MGAPSAASESEIDVSAHDRGSVGGGASARLPVRKPKALHDGFATGGDCAGFAGA